MMLKALATLTPLFAAVLAAKFANDEFTCDLKDEHCIYVNGDPGAYSVTFKNGKDSTALVCDKKYSGVMTGPCKATTQSGALTINVACRETDNFKGRRPNVDIAFVDDQNGNFTVHNGARGTKIWADFEDTANDKLSNGRGSNQYPHLSAIVNCFSDNRYGP